MPECIWTSEYCGILVSQAQEEISYGSISPEPKATAWLAVPEDGRPVLWERPALGLIHMPVGDSA